MRRRGIERMPSSCKDLMSEEALAHDMLSYFLSQIRKVPGGCWFWTGELGRGGYGIFRFLNRKYLAHRWAYELLRGEIPEGLLACHKCDVRCCVNPAHIFLGTHEDNMRDALKKGRISPKHFKLALVGKRW